MSNLGEDKMRQIRAINGFCKKLMSGLSNLLLNMDFASWTIGVIVHLLGGLTIIDCHLASISVFFSSYHKIFGLNITNL